MLSMEDKTMMVRSEKDSTYDPAEPISYEGSMDRQIFLHKALGKIEKEDRLSLQALCKKILRECKPPKWQNDFISICSYYEIKILMDTIPPTYWQDRLYYDLYMATLQKG